MENNQLVKKTSSSSIFSKYLKLGLISFSMTVIEDDKGKKQFYELPKYNDLTTSKLNKNHNGYGLRMGTQLKDTDEYIIGLDIDNKPDTDEIFNGLTKWKQLLSTHNFINLHR